MRILTWNVRQGGGSRKQALVDVIDRFGADIAVLSEFKASNGSDLLEMLAKVGFTEHAFTADPAGGYATVLIASRHSLEPGGSVLPSDLDAHAWQHVHVPSLELDIVGCYIPGSEDGVALPKGHRKMAFWDGMLELEPSLRDERTVIAGDLNTGRHHLDERGATLNCSEQFEEMLSRGWTDAFRSVNGDVWAPSWWSPRYGNGFRLDHVLCSPASRAAVRCRYVTEIDDRPFAGPEKGLTSDHAVMITDFA